MPQPWFHSSESAVRQLRTQNTHNAYVSTAKNADAAIRWGRGICLNGVLLGRIFRDSSFVFWIARPPRTLTDENVHNNGDYTDRHAYENIPISMNTEAESYEANSDRSERFLVQLEGADRESRSTNL